MASEKLATRLPLDVVLTSASCPALPISITLLNPGFDMIVLSLCDVGVVKQRHFKRWEPTILRMGKDTARRSGDDGDDANNARFAAKAVARSPGPQSARLVRNAATGGKSVTTSVRAQSVALPDDWSNLDNVAEK